MSSVASPAGLVHVGMDTSKKTIMMATLWPGEQVPQPGVRRAQPGRGQLTGSGGITGRRGRIGHIRHAARAGPA